MKGLWQKRWINCYCYCGSQDKRGEEVEESERREDSWQEHLKAKTKLQELSSWRLCCYGWSLCCSRLCLTREGSYSLLLVAFVSINLPTGSSARGSPRTLSWSILAFPSSTPPSPPLQVSSPDFLLLLFPGIGCLLFYRFLNVLWCLFGVLSSGFSLGLWIELCVWHCFPDSWPQCGVKHVFYSFFFFWFLWIFNSFINYARWSRYCLINNGSKRRWKGG